MATALDNGSRDERPDLGQPGMAKFLCISFLCALAVVLLCWGMSRLFYYMEDPLERVTIDTRNQLAQFERTGDARPLKAWLLTHDDGGEAMNAYGTVMDWSITHQREFIAFLHSLGTEDGERICRSYAFSLADNGKTKEFRQAYQGYDDPKLTVLKSYLYEAVPWPAENAPGKG